MAPDPEDLDLVIEAAKIYIQRQKRVNSIIENLNEDGEWVYG